MRVLIAEDHPDISDLMKIWISRAGHEPSLATNGYDAVKLAAEISPNLVLLDINMPEMDGYETAYRLRKQFADRTSIFALTATPVDMQLAEQSGFDGVISKPFDGEKLAALLDERSYLADKSERKSSRKHLEIQ